MSWNEPGERDKGKKKDPWGKDEEGPPNIDEALRQLQRKLRAVFGQQDGQSSGFGQGNKATPNKTFGFSLIGVIALVIYVISGIYVVEPAEEAVICRLGKYIETVGPGPHWIAPLIETKDIVNVQEVKTSKHGGQMLTKDENIVSAEIAVQYRINSAEDYLFSLVQPEKSLQQVSESALRAVVGQSTLNEVLTSGRGEIGAEIRKQIQQILDNYHSGLQISDLAMQQTKAPEEVKAAFDDAIKAQQDEERLVNEAEAYARKIIPIAEGRAKRTFEEARAYKERAILEAQGKTAKFAEVLPQYQRAPQVTRDRLFIDTLQEVYTNTSKILIDVNGGNNVVYLPLDKIIAQNTVRSSSREEDDGSQQSMDKTSSTINGPSRSMSRRPTYEDAERPVRGGA
ncbi:MAG: FtsH protease activity modulator HflK [Proteobacteria bacterium]|nr:FtsH protease activity modulator HflK [Pseudomonadota bacterium]